MLTNDIFFLYPPGYCGNYLQWIINVSEKDRSQNVILDPLLPDSTTHGYVRKPTHLGPMHVLVWLARNGPISPQTFVVNCHNTGDSWTEHPGYAAHLFMRVRSNPRCISISAVDPDDIYLGALNCYTKWSVWFKANSIWNKSNFYNFDIDGGQDPCVPDISDRNWLYDNWRTKFPINKEFAWDEFEFGMRKNRAWYNVRNLYTPEEVNASEYNVYEFIPTNLIKEIRLGDLLSHGFLERTFIPWIEQQNIGDFNWEHAIAYHDTYLAAQKNLQWLNSINAMRQYKYVDKFLQKHSLVQALVLDDLGEILENVPNWRILGLADILGDLGYDVEK